MTNNLPPHRRLWPIDRAAIVATHFERTDGGYLYRPGGVGPAVMTSAAERDGWVARARRVLLWHGAGLLIGGIAAWLAVDRLLPDIGSVARGALFAVALSLVGIVLHLSYEGSVAAPMRAFAGRPIVRPSRDPDPAARIGYGTIATGVVAALILAALGSDKPAAFYVGFAVVAVIAGLWLAIRTFWSDLSLTPGQRRRAREAEKRAEAARPAPEPAGCATLLLVAMFFLIEIALVLGALFGTIALTLAIGGSSFDDPDGVLFAVGFVLGSVLGLVIAIPVDRWCKRLTGISPIDDFPSLPIGW